MSHATIDFPFQEESVPLFRLKLAPGRFLKKSKQTRGRVLAGTPVRVEDRPLKKQNGRSDIQSKDQIDQALPQPRPPRLSRPRPQ
jgi:hypothetical protein